MVTCSALQNIGIVELWKSIEEHRRVTTESGEFEERRKRQLLKWMWSMVRDWLMSELRNHPAVKDAIRGIEEEVLAGKLTPTLAAEGILERFSKRA